MKKRAVRAGWNGRPARGFRRLAGSISRSEPAQWIARRGGRGGGRCPTRCLSESVLKVENWAALDVERWTFGTPSHAIFHK